MSTLDRGGGLAAAVATSGARVPAAAAPANPIAGDLRLERLDSAVFGNARTLRVLVPSGCDVPANRERRYPVLYLNHGQNLFAPSTSTFTDDHRALLGGTTRTPGRGGSRMRWRSCMLLAGPAFQGDDMRRALLALVMTIGVAAAAFAGDVTGKWVGNVETPNGPLELTYDLKVEGEHVTGTVSSPMGSLPIDKGKLAGDVLTYTVSIEGTVITHEAKLSAAGDEIAIKATGDWGTSEYVVKKVAAAR